LLAVSTIAQTHTPNGTDRKYGTNRKIIGTIKKDSSSPKIKPPRASPNPSQNLPASRWYVYSHVQKLRKTAKRIAAVLDFGGATGTNP
jgi:hypothetical protein